MSAENTIVVPVWFANTHGAPDASWSGWRCWLRDEELDTATHFGSPTVRQQFLVGRALMRAMLSKFSGREAHQIPFKWGRYGKPMWGEPEVSLFFNLAHTTGAVVCGCTVEGDVGIDLERADRKVNLALADRYFAPEEVSRLRKLDSAKQAQHFLALWTMKEAFLKAIGTGLVTPLDSFACEPTPHGGQLLRCPEAFGPPEHWRLTRFALGTSYLGAIALRTAKRGKVECSLQAWHWEDFA